MEAEGAIPNPSNTRIAVVTGGNKHRIGLEVCRQLASAGVTVVLTARDKTRGTAAMEKLREAGLSNVIFHQLEITDAPSIARLADFLKPCFGKLDVLINNAAILGVEYLLDPSLTSEEKCSEMDMRQRLEWLSNGPGDLRHCQRMPADKLLRHQACHRSLTAAAASFLLWENR
ncbi:hypothetical protein PVAP13_7KG263800 [Panicum virgatum]|uniref:Uncharacterized protein n=1 Tax=Panicum virgatum TaxID=38727 RepID=A0A8T0QEP4_PANVG|nr:hypothetical protein PVAP13_7KG263800 [Panicum virgatum]